MQNQEMKHCLGGQQGKAVDTDDPGWWGSKQLLFPDFSKKGYILLAYGKWKKEYILIMENLGSTEK